MEDLCRLCLSVCSEQIHNLYENSELVTKIATCLQLEILKVDSLPNQICYGCNDRVDQIHSFLKSVIENQNVLYCHLKSGKDCLDHFYSSLKTVKKEIEDNSLKLKEEDTTEISNEIEIKYDATENTNEIEIKPDTTEIINETQEKNENNDEADIDFNSDDDITLISLKSEKEKTDFILKVNDKRNKDKKKIKSKMPKQKNSDAKETKENVLLHSTQIIEYKCLMCFEIFDARRKLTKHYRNAHKPAEPPTYDIKKYSTVQEDRDTKFKCGYCEKMYCNKCQVQKHIQYKHQERRPYNCNLCGRTYKLISEIVAHLRAHDGPKLFCSYNCGYSSVYINALKIHEKKHRNESKYKCEKCGKGFEVRTWYEDHLNIHTGAKPFMCNICGQAYPFRKYLVKHQTESHPVAEPSLDQTKYICVHCSLPCESKIALKTHLSKKHGIIEGKKCYLCDICGKSFKRTSNLIGHKKYHLGVKKHTCSICNKSFITRYKLRRHELTHTGEKRLACDKCGKRYVSKDALVKHILRYHSLTTAKSPKNYVK